MGRENIFIFKPTIGNESLHQDSNNNGVIIVNFATSKGHITFANYVQNFTQHPAVKVSICTGNY